MEAIEAVFKLHKKRFIPQKRTNERDVDDEEAHGGSSAAGGCFMTSISTSPHTRMYEYTTHLSREYPPPAHSPRRTIKIFNTV
jgi:hypothetical protein